MVLGLGATATGHACAKKAGLGEEKPHRAERHTSQTHFVLLGATKGHMRREATPSLGHHTPSRAHKNELSNQG